MPLSILVPLILVGLPLVIGTVYWITRENALEPLTAEAAHMLFARDFPNLEPDQIWISENGNSAILRFKGTRQTGLLLPFGSSYLTRVLEPGKYQTEKIEDGVQVRLHEFTLKQFKFETSEPDAIVAALNEE